MDASDAANTLKSEVKGLDSYLDPIDYQNAVVKAQQDTGYALPVTSTSLIFWILERAKRHLFFSLLSESAHKFKVKQYNLQHRFEHYRSIVEYMDTQWKEYLDEIGVDEQAIFMGGMKIDAGFQYDEETGKDTTYDSENRVIFTPTESD
jgi:hypothetical protein